MKQVHTFFVALIMLVFLFKQTAGAEVLDRVVASVGDEAVTLFEVDKAGAALFGQIKKSSSTGDREAKLADARKKVLDGLVEKMLLIREAKRIGVEIGEEDVNSAIEKVKEENKIGQEELVMALKKEGLTYEKYKEEIKGQMLRARVVDRKVKSSIDISDDDVRFYYERNEGEFSADEEIRVRHILFLVPKVLALHPL